MVKLRNENYWYGVIAKITGVPKTAIKSFCVRNGLGGTRGKREAEEAGLGYCRS